MLSEYGVPAAGDFQQPAAAPGQAVVEVLAAGLNPVDVTTAAGTFYGGRPRLPCVAGREAVALLDGRRVYFDAPIAPFGSMAERSLIDPASALAVRDDVADGVAVALGIAGLVAWLALTWRAELQPGEHVLVLGASGIVGQVALQAARVLGAGRVVAAARSRDGLALAIERGADAAVPLDEADLAPALAAAGEGRIDVVVDPLFGEPLVAALHAASVGARVVHLGASAGSEATIPSPLLRGKLLTLMGHSTFAAPPAVKGAAYESLLAAAAAGEIVVDVLEFGLDRVEDAWRAQREGTRAKIVIVP
ncbi:MAG TPA: zinc-binding dehydrogenase [Solirubrobacteraceae bacterium]|nr:zinc-binding dehydrogenase [Solirubrobacteraceae bacterium]